MSEKSTQQSAPNLDASEFTEEFAVLPSEHEESFEEYIERLDHANTGRAALNAIVMLNEKESTLEHPYFTEE